MGWGKIPLEIRVRGSSGNGKNGVRFRWKGVLPLEIGVLPLERSEMGAPNDDRSEMGARNDDRSEKSGQNAYRSEKGGEGLYRGIGTSIAPSYFFSDILCDTKRNIY